MPSYRPPSPYSQENALKYPKPVLNAVPGLAVLFTPNVSNSPAVTETTIGLDVFEVGVGPLAAASETDAKELPAVQVEPPFVGVTVYSE